MLYKIYTLKRGNSDYVYRKYRLGKKVITEYVGKKDEVEDLVAEEEILGLNQREMKKRKKQAQQVEKLLERRLDDVMEEVTTLANCYYLIAGYHTRKGQWRKYRG